MTSNVRRLAQLAGVVGPSYVRTDWDVVERDLGIELPSDYKELLAVFPPGTFFAVNISDGDVTVTPPTYLDGKPDYLQQFTGELDELRAWRGAHPEDVPHAVYPDSNGMLPWARSGREGLFWVRNTPDPATWTVAISNGGIWRFDNTGPVVEEFPVGAVDFLIGLVTGEIKSYLLNPLGTHVGPAACGAFRSIPETEWHQDAYTTSPAIKMISLRDL